MFRDWSATPRGYNGIDRSTRAKKGSKFAATRRAAAPTHPPHPHNRHSFRRPHPLLFRSFKPIKNFRFSSFPPFSPARHSHLAGPGPNPCTASPLPPGIFSTAKIKGQQSVSVAPLPAYDSLPLHFGFTYFTVASTTPTPTSPTTRAFLLLASTLPVTTTLDASPAPYSPLSLLHIIPPVHPRLFQQYTGPYPQRTTRSHCPCPVAAFAVSRESLLALKKKSFSHHFISYKVAPPAFTEMSSKSDRDKRASSKTKSSSGSRSTQHSSTKDHSGGGGTHHSSGGGGGGTHHSSSRDRPTPMDEGRQRIHAAGPRAMEVTKPKPMARAGYGRMGIHCRLETNFFRMHIPKKLVVSQYAIHIYRLKDPNDTRNRKRSKTSRGGGSASADANKAWIDVASTEPIFWNRAVFERMCHRYGRDFGCALAYDGRSIAYAAREVNRKCLAVRYRVTVGREGAAPTDQEQRDGKTENVEVEIHHAKYLKFDEVLSERIGTIASAEYLAALDVVIAASPMTKYVQIGRSFYSPDRAVPLGRRNITASAWRGFYQSARLSLAGLIVNLDESFTAFWNRGGRPLMDLIRDANDGRELSTSDGRGLRDVSTKLKALKVRAVHTGITYKVHGFSNKGADRIMFDSASEGRKVSIAEYFHSTYNIRLRHPHQPCVKTNPKRETFLPMELLTVMENQRLAGMLSQDQTQGIVKIASSKPHIRREAAIKTMQRLNHSNDRVCRDFGVQVAPGLVSVDARILPVPLIQYKNMKKIKPSAGQWKASREQFASGGLLYTWAVINMTRLRSDDANRFIADLVRSGRKSGVHIPNGRPLLFSCDSRYIADKLREVAHKFASDKSLHVEQYPLQLVIIIKDRQDAPTYNLIKRTGDIELGVATQVCLQKHCEPGSRGREMYCDNVMLKINSKIGGQNAVVSSYQSDRNSNMRDVPFIDKPHIVLGADVTHPMVGGRSPSVAALVGSRDRQGVQYSGAIRNQPGRQEVIADLGGMFKEVYWRWYSNFKRSIHVDAIIMFRDGVSDGQFEEVLQVELAALRRACGEINASFHPKITYIIVTKRHHARFFAEKKHQDRSGNIQAGTVIDKDIVSREFYDFYLNSHAGIQGTSKPSKYTILLDENNIPVDALQGYIFRLAHGFVRCNRSVSMVNSAYYAHLLAFRGRAYLGEDVSDTASSASTDSVVPRAPSLHNFISKRLFFV